MNSKKKCSDQTAQTGFAAAKDAVEGRTTSDASKTKPSPEPVYLRILKWKGDHGMTRGSCPQDD